MPYFDAGHSFTSFVSTRYKNLQVLGSGGNSDVYLVVADSGKHEGVLFAIKVFKKIKDKARLQRFEREYEYLRNISHPAIMKVYDKGIVLLREKGQDEFEVPFIVAEYLSTTLNDQIYANTSHIEKISYAYQLISALDYLHTQNPKVVHRDIKPRNIFIKGRSCLLGDFGLMKLLEPPVTYDGNAYLDTVGTTMPAFYRTPDLVSYAMGGNSLTVQSDIYQLGLVLAELFTKDNPCRSSKKFKLTDPIKLREIKDIPGSTGSRIKGEILKMLNEKPEERPTSHDLLQSWKAIFLTVVSQSQDIDGKAFS